MLPILPAALVACFHPALPQGPRMVRDVFRLAKENAPAIIFIDEVDAIATARFDAQTGADREVQRILMELLNQMDGFDQTVNVKVIMATNRADTLDPALLRPGRLDRKIEFPLPDRRQKRLVFQVGHSTLIHSASGRCLLPVMWHKTIWGRWNNHLGICSGGCCLYAFPRSHLPVMHVLQSLLLLCCLGIVCINNLDPGCAC
eukprot:GHRR01035719.1.p1 GENE.GHRR01035719.1~~GHRR01035719.1.p1  ORF type:complete len:202 (-),score=35.90 GHRR01035719.1:441-1046(-)